MLKEKDSGHKSSHSPGHIQSLVLQYLDVTLAQRKLLAKAIRELCPELACGHYLEARQCRFYTCNNKVLAKDGGLDEIR